ncbi:MAG: DNA adenine methylase [Bacteroidales bacterium]|nr:DNA adenine methylase [Bacteroidales bacterium]MDD4575701.1 DNA adenine methylase [Bacteroidales bacterium]
MIKSPLRYPGGKSRAVSLISQILPEFDEFREPFLGGGSVFIWYYSKKCVFYS